MPSDRAGASLRAGCRCRPIKQQLVELHPFFVTSTNFPSSTSHKAVTIFGTAHNMSSAALLDQDFDSESGDDNFNPAPAGDSENDGAGDSEDDRNVTRKLSNAQGRRRSSAREMGYDDEVEIMQRSPVNGVNGERRNGSTAPKDEQDEGTKQTEGRGLDGAADDLEDEEDDDDSEAEEEEEAISVCIGAVIVIQSFLTC